MADSRPVPDPTVLTTQQSQREIAALRDWVEARLESIERVSAEIHASADKLPQRVDSVVGHLRELHEEKFHSVQKQFDERDTRTEQKDTDSKTAINAALQAAKEAVAKSEAATIKQMDQMGETMRVTTTGLTGQIGDVKDRITIIEGRGGGIKDFLGWIVGAVAVAAFLFDHFNK